MSKRIQHKTDMTNKEFAVAAITSAGLSYEEMGSNTLRITSGNLVNATLDLTTGTISGDSDFGHRKETLGSLRQAYTEAKYRHEAAREGVQIKQRLKRGEDVVLLCRMASHA
jgi:hypothetical protein